MLGCRGPLSELCHSWSYFLKEIKDTGKTSLYIKCGKLSVNNNTAYQFWQSAKLGIRVQQLRNCWLLSVYPVLTNTMCSFQTLANLWYSCVRQVLHLFNVVHIRYTWDRHTHTYTCNAFKNHVLGWAVKLDLDAGATNRCLINHPQNSSHAFNKLVSDSTRNRKHRRAAAKPAACAQNP